MALILMMQHISNAIKQVPDRFTLSDTVALAKHTRKITSRTLSVH